MSLALHYQWRTARRRRLRFALGVVGVFGAIALLAALGAGMDSYTRAYVEFATARTGRPDAYVAGNGAERGGPALFDGDEIGRLFEDVRAVRGSSPRLRIDGAWLLVDGSEPRRLLLQGLDLERERSVGLGEVSPAVELGPGGIVLSKAAAEEAGVSVGDRVRVRLVPDPGEDLAHEFEVAGIAERQDLFESWADEYAIVRLDELASAVRADARAVLEAARGEAGWAALPEDRRRVLVYLVLAFAERLGIDVTAIDPARLATEAPGWTLRLSAEIDREPAPVLSTHLAVRFDEGEGLYDSMDLAASVRRLRRVGEEIRERTGLAYRVELPRAQVLQATETSAPLLQTVFLLVTALVLAVSGLLIHSLLSISVEERARDLAILRTMGAKRSLVFRIVLSEAALIGLFGIGLGLPAGLALCRLVVGRLAARQGVDAELVVRGSTLALAGGLGALAVLASGLVPAIRSAGARIVDGLAPVRMPAPAGRWTRDRGLDRRFAVVGAVVTGLVGLTTWALVTVLASRDPSTGALLIGALVLTLLAGLTLTTTAFQPLFERAVLVVLRPIASIGAGFARQNLGRFRRRNASTSLLFSLSVAVVVLVGSIWTLQSGQIVALSRHMNGSDLRIELRERPDDLLAPSTPFSRALAEGFGDRIGCVSRVLRPREEGIVFGATLSDTVLFERLGVGCFGVDRDLAAAIFADGASFAAGGPADLARLAEGADPVAVEPDAERVERSRRRVLLHPDVGPIVLSAALATRLGVGVGDHVHLAVVRGRVEREKRFEVVAIVRRLPGFRRVRNSPDRAHGSAVLVSDREFGPGHLFNASGAVSTYLVRAEGSPELARDLAESLGETYHLSIEDTDAEIARAEKWIVRSQIVLSAVLVLVVALAFLGLVASMYSSVLERARELAILKALGMRTRRILGSLAIEGVALMTASGLVGVATGYVLALVLVRWIHDLLSELPARYEFPWLLVGSVVAWSVVLGVVGAWASARRLLSRPAAEMLRRAE